MFVVDSLLCFGGKTWYNAVRSSALMFSRKFGQYRYTLFFCKNIFYKNIEAEILRNFKNILTIKPRLRFCKG